MQAINWRDFESKYWSPEKGKSHEVLLSNWRQETRSYDDGKTEKPVIVFDVIRVDNESFVSPKLFATGAVSFATAVKPIIETAEHDGKESILIMMDFSTDKKYRFVDLRKLRGE